MNTEILAAAHPHIKEEWFKQRAELGVLDRAVQIAAAHARGEKLPGCPKKDAPETVWQEYFIHRAVLDLTWGRAA